ncbi:MAG: hypothetical protein LBQ58_00270 [Synergistaceae bacterium]|jgi:hypothetical protein|nr:hypothetical protein [Synergistaceae bacterium]
MLRAKKIYRVIPVILLLAALLCLTYGQSADASWFFSEAAVGKSGAEAPARKAPIFRGANNGFDQILYNYDSGPDSRLEGPSVDWQGQYYYLKKNSDATTSYIFENYGPENKTNPFITINGNVNSFEVTSDRDASYVYYKLVDDDNSVYRLPLERGATGAVKKTFSFEGTPFVFRSFTLADDPDQFLLCSEPDANLGVRIGLFSFDGGTEPIRSWTATLPQEWEDDYYHIGEEDDGYWVIYEASTAKVWLTVRRTFYDTSRYDYFNTPWWFFEKDISTSGELSYYNQASEIPGWSSGNLKTLGIDRYGRLVSEYNGSLPDEVLSFREFDPATGNYKDGIIQTWFDDDGTERPIEEFFYKAGDGSNWRSFSGAHLDGQGNIHLKYSRSYTDSGDAFQRIAIFAQTGADAIGDSVPDAAADNGAEFRPDDILLKSSLPTLPNGYVITGSTWVIYLVDGDSSVYVGYNTDSGNTHKVARRLSNGKYIWRVAYEWQKSGLTTARGSTKWSRFAEITVVDSPNNPSSSGGGGGCSAGFGSLMAVFVSAMLIKRKAR